MGLDIKEAEALALHYIIIPRFEANMATQAVNFFRFLPLFHGFCLMVS